MAQDPKQLSAYVDAALDVIGLNVTPEWRAAVVANLTVTAKAAADIAAFDLPDDQLPAPIFEPGD